MYSWKFWVGGRVAEAIWIFCIQSEERSAKNWKKLNPTTKTSKQNIPPSLDHPCISNLDHEIIAVYHILLFNKLCHYVPSQFLLNVLFSLALGNISRSTSTASVLATAISIANRLSAFAETAIWYKESSLGWFPAGARLYWREWELVSATVERGGWRNSQAIDFSPRHPWKEPIVAETSQEEES